MRADPKLIFAFAVAVLGLGALLYVPSSSAKPAPGKTSAGATLRVDPGPPAQKGDGTPKHCDSDVDCVREMERCTPQHTCLCKGEESKTRCNPVLQCQNLMTNIEHCGKCKNACPFGKECIAGHCASLKCGQGQSTCDGYCADLKDDNSNCGKCHHSCPGSRVCIKGHCEN